MVQQMPKNQENMQVTHIENDFPILNLCCEGPSCAIGASRIDSVGLALDAIIVVPSLDDDIGENISGNANTTKSSTEKGIVASSDFLLQFPLQANSYPYAQQPDQKILIQINGNNLQESVLSMNLPKEKGKIMCTFQQGHSTKPSTEVLQQLVQQRIVTPGRNLIRYILVERSGGVPLLNVDNKQNEDSLEQAWTPIGQAEAYVFLWSVHDTIIISDIDGTVTKSDVRGVIDTLLTENYAHVHEGVCSLFSELAKYDRKINPGKGKVRLLYLSSRPMRLINSTRKFISSVSQINNPDNPKSTMTVIWQSCMGSTSNIATNDQLTGNKEEEYTSIPSCLTPGPIFLHTGTLSKVLVTELVHKSTHEFKADLIARQVVLPFICAGKNKSGSQLFLAGFGNKKTDFLAYEMAGMNSHHIYIINKRSVLVSTNPGLEYEGESIADADDIDFFPGRSIALSSSPKEDISSNKISVSNPEKRTPSSSQQKRRFKGYGDPQLRKELIQRLDSQ